MAYGQLLQMGTSYNTPVRTFYLTADDGESAEDAIATLPTNIPGGSICEYLTDDGLRVYMFKRIADKGAVLGEWVEI